MDCRAEYLFAAFSIGTIAFHLLSPAGAYALVVGDSMEPTIPAGCSVVASESWDGESSLEGEIVSYESSSLEYGPAGLSSVGASVPVAHRVVAEYDAYDMADANHTVTDGGLFVVESGTNVTMMASAQPYREATALEGERVLVLAGDNNRRVDPMLVPASDVSAVLDADARLTVGGADSWPCRGAAAGSRAA